MKKPNKHRNWLRAAALMPALLLVAGGISYAAFQSRANSLDGNTINTASAELVISADGSNWNYNSPGFNFDNLIPGGDAMPVAGYPFYLKNQGNMPQTLNFKVTGPLSYAPNDVDISKVDILLTTVASGVPVQKFSLAALSEPAGVTLSNRLQPSQSQLYKLQVQMEDGAVTSTSANISDFNFVFTGVVGSN